MFEPPRILDVDAFPSLRELIPSSDRPSIAQNERWRIGLIIGKSGLSFFPPFVYLIELMVCDSGSGKSTILRSISLFGRNKILNTECMRRWRTSRSLPSDSNSAKIDAILLDVRRDVGFLLPSHLSLSIVSDAAAEFVVLVKSFAVLSELERSVVGELCAAFADRRMHR